MNVCPTLAFPPPPTSSPRRSPLSQLFAGGELSVWIGGYIVQGSTFDSLLAGVWERKGLRFVGCVSKGWTPGEKADLFARLNELPLKRCPFHNLESGSGLLPPGAVCRWLFPTLKMPVEREHLHLPADFRAVG